MSQPLSPDSAVTELRRAALHWLCVTDATVKANGVRQLSDLCHGGKISVDMQADSIPQHTVPGRPHRPELVLPRALRQRSMHTTEGRAALIHALAHIEFNAINLALDAIWRFS